MTYRGPQSFIPKAPDNTGTFRNKTHHNKRFGGNTPNRQLHYQMSKDNHEKNRSISRFNFELHTRSTSYSKKKNEITDARIAAETDAESDAKNAITQFFYCAGSSTVVTISAIGCDFLGCWLGSALNPPYQSDPSVDPEGMILPGLISTGMIYGCLGGGGQVLQVQSMEYTNLGVECRPST